MFLRSDDKVASTLGSALPVDKSIGAPQDPVTIPEGTQLQETVLRSDVVDWNVADYKSKKADHFDVRQFDDIERQ